jgi:hypothetical protein
VNVITDNLHAVASYWWVILVGVILPFLDILKFLHPKNREFRLHPSLRIGIVALAVVVAEVLAYSDQGKNLARVVEDKRLQNVEMNSLNDQLRSAMKERDDFKKAADAYKGSETSIKKQMVRLAATLAAFFDKRWKSEPKCNQTSSMTPEQQRAVIEPCAKYNMETMRLYSQLYGPQVMAMVGRFKAKGVEVSAEIERCAGDGWCQPPIAVQLRALAERLDARDNLKP